MIIVHREFLEYFLQIQERGYSIGIVFLSLFIKVGGRIRSLIRDFDKYVCNSFFCSCNHKGDYWTLKFGQNWSFIYLNAKNYLNIRYLIEFFKMQEQLLGGLQFFTFGVWVFIWIEGLLYSMTVWFFKPKCICKYMQIYAYILIRVARPTHH